jgi:hypothetical protein
MLWCTSCASFFALADGAEMWARWETPRERFDEYTGKFSLDMKPRFNRPVGERKQFPKVDAG